MAKKQEILKLSKEGTPVEDIAEEVGVKESYVEKIIAESKEGKLPQERSEILGSEMEHLRSIISEVSRTQKVDAIIRSFSSYDPDDLETLSNLCKRAHIPKSDISFIVDNWAKEREVEVPSKIKKDLKEKEEKGKKEEKAEEEGELDLDKLRKNKLRQLREERAMLEYKKEIAEQKKLLESMTPETKGLKTRKIVRFVPRTNAKGEVIKDETGQPIYQRVEEEVPMDYPYGMGMGMGFDPFMNPMFPRKSEDSGTNKLLEGIVQTQQKTIDSIRDQSHTQQIEALKSSFEKKIDMMEASHKSELEKIAHLLREKSTEDKFRSFIGELEDKIEDMKRNAKVSDRHKLIETQKEVITDVGDKVYKGIDRLAQGVEDMAKEGVEGRRHQRFLERMYYGEKYGLSPTQIREIYEKSVVPEVSEEEMEKEMKKAGYMGE